MRHRLAIVTGGLVASTFFGFLTQLAPSYTSVHHIGKLVLDTLAILFLAWSAWRVRRARAAVTAEQGSWCRRGITPERKLIKRNSSAVQDFTEEVELLAVCIEQLDRWRSGR